MTQSPLLNFYGPINFFSIHGIQGKKNYHTELVLFRKTLFQDVKNYSLDYYFLNFYKHVISFVHRKSGWVTELISRYQFINLERFISSFHDFSSHFFLDSAVLLPLACTIGFALLMSPLPELFVSRIFTSLSFFFVLQKQPHSAFKNKNVGQFSFDLRPPLLFTTRAKQFSWEIALAMHSLRSNLLQHKTLLYHSLY